MVAPPPSQAPIIKGSYRSLPQLQIDGKDAPEDLLNDILQIVVEESLSLPGMFTLVIQNDYFSGQSESEVWRYDSLLQIGTSIKIGFEAATVDASEFSQEEEPEGVIIEGEITAIETHFTEKSQAPVIIRGYDTCHRLSRGQHTRSFQNVTDSDVVEKLAAEMGIRLGKIEPSGEVHEYLMQSQQSHWQFLRDRAARIGFELFNQNGKLHFRKPKQDDELSLQWLRNLKSFRVRVSSAEQIKAVEVRGWDAQQKKAIVSIADGGKNITTTEQGQGTETSTKFSGNKPSQPTRRIVNQQPASYKEADAIAKAAWTAIGDQFATADARAEGNPKIRPGKLVKLEGLGNYSGKYYITETRHRYEERIYITEFSVRGSRSGDLLSTLAAAASSSAKPAQGLLVGIVTDNKDPQGWGRIKVKFPTLSEDHTSHWARVVSIGAGSDRGFDCLPEINDEVFVAFEQGDMNRPYIIGGVWNGKDKPPGGTEDNLQDGKVRLRTIRTRTGHQIQFIEEDKGSSKAGIHIRTKDGNELFINDSDKTISLKSTGDLKIDAKGNIDITAGGTITVQGLLIRLN